VQCDLVQRSKQAEVAENRGRYMLDARANNDKRQGEKDPIWRKKLGKRSQQKQADFKRIQGDLWHR